MQYSLLESISRIFLTLVLSCGFYFASAVQSLSSFQFFAVGSHSMAPALKRGDLIVIKSQIEYSPGDVVSYRLNNQIITHRIKTRDGQFYQIKGDVNSTPDNELVKDEQIIGKVMFSVPKLGYLSILKHYVQIN